MTTSAEIDQKTKEFLKRGGQIQQIPTGLTTETYKTRAEVQSQLNAVKAVKGRVNTKNAKIQFHLTKEDKHHGV